MSGSIYGNLFCVSSWGESHGKGIGVVVDGCPAGLTLNEEIIQSYLNRRKPGTTIPLPERKMMLLKFYLAFLKAKQQVHQFL